MSPALETWSLNHWTAREVPVSTVLDAIPINHYRVLGRVPCAIQQVLISYLFYLFFKKLLFLYWGFPSGSDGKASVCNAGDPGSIPGLGRSPGEENGSSLQYSCLKNPMDCGAW